MGVFVENVGMCKVICMRGVKCMRNELFEYLFIIDR